MIKSKISIYENHDPYQHLWYSLESEFNHLAR